MMRSDMNKQMSGKMKDKMMKKKSYAKGGSVKTGRNKDTSPQRLRKDYNAKSKAENKAFEAYSKSPKDLSGKGDMQLYDKYEKAAKTRAKAGEKMKRKKYAAGGSVKSKGCGMARSRPTKIR